MSKKITYCVDILLFILNTKHQIHRKKNELKVSTQFLTGDAEYRKETNECVYARADVLLAVNNHETERRKEEEKAATCDNR